MKLKADSQCYLSVALQPEVNANKLYTYVMMVKIISIPASSLFALTSSCNAYNFRCLLLIRLNLELMYGPNYGIQLFVLVVVVVLLAQAAPPHSNNNQNRVQKSGL